MVKTKYVAVGIVVLLAIIAVAVYVATRPEVTPTPVATPTTPTETTPAKPTEKITLRWGTSRVGSSGHRALSFLAEIINRYMPDVEITVVPTAGAVVSVKSFAKGELDGCYGSDIALRELLAYTGRFEGFEPEVKRLPAHTFWAYSIAVTMAIHDENIGKITSWSDLDGKRIFTAPLGWDVSAQIRRALDALGIRYEHVEMDLGMVGKNLEEGAIVATTVYVTGGATVAPWISELEMTTDIAILNPSPEEVERLKAAGFEVVEIDPRGIFSTDVNVDKIIALPFYYGFHVGLNVPEDVVYRMLKTLEEHVKELAKMDPAFKELAEDFVGFQVRGISALPELPVHPGLAKFLKEKGVWRDEWKIAGQE